MTEHLNSADVWVITLMFCRQSLLCRVQRAQSHKRQWMRLSVRKDCIGCVSFHKYWENPFRPWFISFIDIILTMWRTKNKIKLKLLSGLLINNGQKCEKLFYFKLNNNKKSLIKLMFFVIILHSNRQTNRPELKLINEFLKIDNNVKC